MGSSDDIEPGSKTVAEYHTEPDKGVVEVGRENIYQSIKPHESYEGAHRYDPYVTWTAEEERIVVRKTDIRLLAWLCVMVRRSPRLPTTMTNQPIVLRTSTRSWQSVQRSGR